MKKLLATLLVTVMTVGLMAGCGSKQSTGGATSNATESSQTETTVGNASEESTKEGKFKIGICAMMPNNAWMAKNLELIEKECTEDADQFEYTLNAGQDAAQQQDILESYMTQDFDLIILMPQDSALLQDICSRIYEAGIPLIVAERPIEGEDYVSYIGGSDYRSGVVAGEYIGDVLGGKGAVAVLRNNVGSEGDLQRYNGFADTLKEKYPEIKIVREADGQESREKGYEVMGDILAAVNHIDAVYAQVDESGIGAEQAIRNAGRDDIKYIIGVGGAQEIFDMMKEDGAIYTGISSYFPTIGQTALQYGKRYLLGETLDKEILDPAMLITEENADEYYHLGF